ncbi:serine hydrolase, partial [Deinococcus sp. A31D244]|uniref:serine hydrolase n=1 Tax=Deinococcus sp. A31D244 TaxID=3397675 RepID=UPI0039E10243
AQPLLPEPRPARHLPPGRLNAACLTLAALLLTPAHAAPVTVTAAWSGTAYRLSLRGLNATDGTLRAEPDGSGATLTFRATLPPLNRTVSTATGDLTISIKGHTVTARTADRRPLRVNLSHIRPGVIPGQDATTAIDLYPPESWTEYQPELTTPCTPSSPGAGVPELPYQPPTFASGPVGFYLAQIDPRTGTPLRVITHDPDSLYPLASTYKQVIAWAAYRDINAGTLTLNTRLSVTEANRSIETYQPGTRTVQNLITRAISNSENTASDVLHLHLTPERVQALADAHGTCHTRVNMTTKAWWAAQAGLLPGVYGPHLPTGAQQTFTAPPEQQAATAAQAVTQAQTLNADTLLNALDRYFYSPAYHPQTEVYLQNRSTPREWAALITRQYLDPTLTPTNRSALRRTLAQGCCRVNDPSVTYWGSKAGSGWRNLTMSGLLTLNTGQTFVYAYFNTGSDLMDTALIERQLPSVAQYILQNARRIGKSTP